MQDNWNKTLPIGEKGENHFLDFELLYFFGLRRDEVTDTRGNNREGEVLLPDGRLLEIKSDNHGNMEKYGNMLVEVAHPRHDGWYHHCKQNGVTNLIVEAFRDGEKHPYFVLHVPFEELENLIDTEGHTFKRTWDGCLRVPVKRIFQTCIGTAILPQILIPSAHEEYLTGVLRDALQLLGIDGQVREQDMIMKIQLQAGVNDICDSWLPEDHPVLFITPVDPSATRK